MKSKGLRLILAGLATSLGMGFLLPSSALAERPSVDCSSLDKSTSEDYEAAREAFMANLNADEPDFDAIMENALDALQFCDSDVYTEFIVGQVYEYKEYCEDALFHYEMNSKKPTPKAKDLKAIYKQNTQALSDVRKNCGDAVNIEVSCATPNAEVAFEGYLASDKSASKRTGLRCPYYGKIRPGSYNMTVSRFGYESKVIPLNVVEKTDVDLINVPELRNLKMRRPLTVRCESRSHTFVLIDPSGKEIGDDYTCSLNTDVVIEEPLWPGTYTIKYTHDDGTKTFTDVVVEEAQSEAEAQQPVIYTVRGTMSRCSGQPLSAPSSAPALLAILGIAGLAVLRRRRKS